MWKSLRHPWVRLPTIGVACGSRFSSPQTNGDLLVNRMNLRNAVFTAAALCALLFSALINAQEPGNVPETKAPAAAQTAPPSPPPPSAEQLAAWKQAREDQVKFDWPNLARYKDADLALGPPAADENRVVFMGDSITDGWHFTGPLGSRSEERRVGKECSSRSEAD